MPGSAGGHSGGFSGGGHSGGFSGGGHSGSFGGGSHGGGFSGGFHTHTGGNRAHIGGGGFYPHHTGGGRRNNQGCGCLSGTLTIFLLPLAIIFFAVFAIFSNLRTNTWFDSSTPGYGYEDMSYEVSSELVTYEKLSEELCKPVENCVETDITGVLDDEGVAQIQSSIDYFYKMTGVQPYFILLGGIDGDAHPDYDTVDSYLYDKYVTMFPGDEGHIIILMLFNNYDYTTWYIIGDDAYFVTDEYACETILNNIDYYAAYSTDVAAVISDAFTQSADDIMTDIEYTYIYPDEDPNSNRYDFTYMPETVTMLQPVIGFIFIVGMIAAVIIVMHVVKKNKKTGTAKTGSSGGEAQGANPYKQVRPSNASTGSYNSASHTPKRAAYPVRCPNCGATAYPKDDGTCEYCGSRLPEQS